MLQQYNYHDGDYDGYDYADEYAYSDYDDYPIETDSSSTSQNANDSYPTVTNPPPSPNSTSAPPLLSTSLQTQLDANRRKTDAFGGNEPVSTLNPFFTTTTVSTTSTTSSSSASSSPTTTSAAPGIAGGSKSLFQLAAAIVSVLTMTFFICSLSFYFSKKVRMAVYSACERCFNQLPRIVARMDCFSARGRHYYPFSAPMSIMSPSSAYSEHSSSSSFSPSSHPPTLASEARDKEATIELNPTSETDEVTENSTASTPPATPSTLAPSSTPRARASTSPRRTSGRRTKTTMGKRLTALFTAKDEDDNVKFFE